MHLCTMNGGGLERRSQQRLPLVSETLAEAVAEVELRTLILQSYDHETNATLIAPPSLLNH